MASDESMTVRSCISMQDDEDENLNDHGNYGGDVDDDDEDDDDDEGMGMYMYMSRLSIESFDELSDGKAKVGEGSVVVEPGLTSDDTDSSAGCYSVPATPPRRSRVLCKDCCVSENEAAAHVCKMRNRRQRRMRMKRRIMRERLLRDKVFWELEDQMQIPMDTASCHSDQSHNSQAVLITRPKGGRRSLRMDIDEFKACRELGFELELDNIIHPPPSSMAFDTASTTSDSNSPVAANWPISSPGDDPRDVKARLRVWAQAVAIASASQHPT